MTTLVKLAETKLDFQIPIENKNLEVSDGKPKLPCERTGDFHLAFLKVTRLGA